MNTPPPSPPLATKRKRLPGFLLGMGLLLTGLLVWFLLTGGPISLTPGHQNGQVQPGGVLTEHGGTAGSRPAPGSPAAPAPDLKTQLEQLLTGVKEANQKKDLSQLLGYYSPNFLQLPQRAQAISRDWKVYDYQRMGFEIKDVRLQDENTATARVTWNVEAQNISTKKIKNISKTYLTRFVKESGNWRIKAIDQTE